MTNRIFDTTTDPETALAAAVEAVRAGEVIVLPTDTVYGVGADAFSPEAVQRLLDAKQRGRDMPPPVLVAEVPQMRALASGIDGSVIQLADAFWPGALTLILRAQDSLRLHLGERGDTIAVRVPDHDFTRELLRRTGPLAVSSANVSGSDAALTIDEAVAMLGDSVTVYLDAGPASGPQPSTILDLSGPEPALLRAGRLGVPELNQIVPGLLPDAPEEGSPVEASDDAASQTVEETPEEAPGETPPEEGLPAPEHDPIPSATQD